MEKRIMITGYQLVYTNGSRDTVKLLEPVTVSSKVELEAVRDELKSRNGCSGVNFSYTEIP